MSLGLALAVGAGEHDHEAIRIADPDLPVLRCRVHERSFDYLSTQARDSLHSGVEIRHLEP